MPCKLATIGPGAVALQEQIVEGYALYQLSVALTITDLGGHREEIPRLTERCSGFWRPFVPMEQGPWRAVTLHDIQSNRGGGVRRVQDDRQRQAHRGLHQCMQHGLALLGLLQG